MPLANGEYLQARGRIARALVLTALPSLPSAAEQIRDSARNLGTLSGEAHELAGRIQVNENNARPAVATS